MNIATYSRAWLADEQSKTVVAVADSNTIKDLEDLMKCTAHILQN